MGEVYLDKKAMIYPAEPTDSVILRELARRHLPMLESVHEAVIAQLSSIRVRVDGLRDFVYRHALPFYVYAEAVGATAAGHEGVVCSAILTYSLPLMTIDLQIDGNFPALRKEEKVWEEIGSRSSLLKAAYLGVRLAASQKHGDHIVKSIVNASVETLIAMERDQRLRRNSEQLSVSEIDIETYWNSPKSRLMGSHIVDLMFDLSATAFNKPLNEDRRKVGRAIGKLRQLADEHMDVWEDLAGGLITFPVLCGLADPVVMHDLRASVERLWSVDETSHVSSAQLITLVMKGNGPTLAIKLANKLREEMTSVTQICFPEPRPVLMMLELRHAQLKRAINQNLSDPPPHASIPVLLEPH